MSTTTSVPTFAAIKNKGVDTSRITAATYVVGSEQLFQAAVLLEELLTDYGVLELEMEFGGTFTEINPSFEKNRKGLESITPGSEAHLVLLPAIKWLQERQAKYTQAEEQHTQAIIDLNTWD